MIKTIIAASVMTTVALAPTNTLVTGNSADQSIKPAVFSAVAADSAESENNSLLLQYVKKSGYDANGNSLGYEETWGDPLTYNQRTDAHFEGGGMSFYALYNGTTSAKVVKDEKGNVTDGIVVTAAPEDSAPSGPLYELMAKEYQKSEWENAGTVTEDGKKLKKVMIDRISHEGTSADNMKKVKVRETVYLEAATGLPVKSEVHEEKNGAMVLRNTFTYEYDRKDRDQELFDISDMNLKDYTSEEVKTNNPHLPIGGKLPNPMADLVSEGTITEAQLTAIDTALGQAKQNGFDENKSDEERLKEALAGIVADGTITQEKADIVVNLFK